MSQRHREPMSSIDAAWLGMDRPTNLMVINGVMLFDEPVEYDRLYRLLDERLAGLFDRFRQRIVPGPSRSRFYWEDDPHFHLRRHLHRVALPAPHDEATLQGLIGDLMSEPLDRAHPLWRFYLIENVTIGGKAGGCAVFGRIHHCIADGMALIQVLLSLTDPSAAEAAPRPQPEEPARRGDGALPRPLRMVAGLTKQGVRLLASLLPTEEEGGLTPAGLLNALQNAGLLTAASAAILAKLLIMAPDRQSPYRGEMGGIKRVAWSPPLPLAQVKEIAHAAGATVNDVLVAAAAGALRRDMLERGAEMAGGDLRALAPMNLRRPSPELRLGNEFSLLYLALPVALDQPYARLMAVKQRMDRLKRSPEALVVYQVLSLLGMLPPEVSHQAVDWFAEKASCVLTNVPGPRQTLYLAGRPISRILFWVPHSGNISMGISLLSYAGSVSLGVEVDERLIPDPERLIAHFLEEFALLVDLGKGLAATTPAASTTATLP
ncbi:MAG TPA: wax ester/triacylglycerol synthase family O-acyltransferase [Caldilineaceae bacterium]|nr:wax ester/triacylglycerol synthase family O-acyltransferase [Caldilineaceae bacterium]